MERYPHICHQTLVLEGYTKIDGTPSKLNKNSSKWYQFKYNNFTYLLMPFLRPYKQITFYIEQTNSKNIGISK
jgi:hypothetical protein